LTAQPSFVVDPATAGDDGKLVQLDYTNGKHKYVVAGSTALINMKTLYGIAPGQDITTSLQAALTLAATYTNGADILIPDPGVYLINGAQQTGTAQSYSYSGQVLIPAVSLANSMPIRIRGGIPGSSGGSTTGLPRGVVLQSNATAGYVFDILPSFTQFGCPWTGAMPIFENLVIRCPDNPTCGALNMLCTQRFELNRVTIDTPTAFTAPVAGSLEALALPQIYNNGDVTVRDANIRGYPVGIRLSEHNVLDNVFLSYCKIAFKGGGASHGNWFGYVDVEECPTVFDGGSAPAFGTPTPVAGSSVYGYLDFENNQTTGSLAPVAFVNDTSSNPVQGTVRFFGTGTQAQPIVGGRSLDVEQMKQPAFGPWGASRAGSWMKSHPYDTFHRMISLSGSGAPGQCNPSLHPWRVDSGSFSVASQQLKSLGASSFCMVPTWKSGLPRTLTMTAVMGASATNGAWLIACANVASNGTSTNPNNAICFQMIVGGKPQVQVNGGTRWLGLPGSTIVAGSTHTAALEIFNDYNGIPSTVKIYYDGVYQATYFLTATEKTSVLPSATWPYFEDGIAIKDAGSTAVTAFNVKDAEPTVQRSLAVLGYGASMTPDGSDVQTVAITNNTAFTINAPNGPPITGESQDMTIEFTNSSGGAITNVSGATWNAAFVLIGGALTDPASTKKRYIRFTWNGAKWIETARAAADY
jgi:hypothetical protein